MTTSALRHRLAAEAVGSAALAAIVIGSGVMAERIAAGNVALALLGNTLATAAGLYVLIVVFAPVSGAHFNPVVTLASTLRGDMRVREACAYVVVQVGAMLLGVLLAHAMFDLPLWLPSTKARSGASQMLSEGVATFMLLIAVFATRGRRVESASAAVALAITAGYWFTASTSFANPAITLARALSDTFAGIRMADVPTFVLGQLAGCLVATSFAAWLFVRDANASSPAVQEPAAPQRGR
jgi:glycerol uptake facilitator-like aquaporin